MRTLQEMLVKIDTRGGAGKSLRKHLTASGIKEWDDITRSSLYDFVDELKETLAPLSQKNVAGYLRTLLTRVQDDVAVPSDYAKILSIKAQPPVKTYLSEDDLAKIETYKPNTRKQEYIKNVFLICAYTGLRVGDAMRLTLDNVVEGNLHYVAEKTKKANAIPLKRGLEERIKWVSEHPEYSVTISYYDRAVKTMCEKVGIVEDVMVYKGGVELKGPKWKYITSHTARVSTATCLNRRGVEIGDIQQLLQHSSVTITERYIVKDQVHLSETAMQFFR